MELVKSSLAETEADISSLKVDISAFQAELLSLSSVPEKTQVQYQRTNTLDARLKASRSSLEAKTKEAKGLRERLIVTSKSEVAGVVQRDDFFTFMAGRLNASSEGVEFAFGAFPAIFIDILGPVMLAIILFL